MDSWQVVQNYLAFAVVAGGVGAYYYTHKQAQPTGGNKRRGSIEPARTAKAVQREVVETVKGIAKGGDASSSKRRKPAKKQARPAAVAQENNAPAVQDDKPEKETDISTAQFAQQMIMARQGANLSTSKTGKDSRVKTVKQSTFKADQSLSKRVDRAGSEADDDSSEAGAASPTLQAGDVSDMMEAKSGGPKSLRLTASSAPEKMRAPKQSKVEQVETKKQRQNRQKKEAEKAAREAEEQERRALAERQRKSAREARGEPPKNGTSAPQAPVNNPWAAQNAAGAASTQSAGVQNGPLLDTFDAESTGSSSGGMEVSTAATSTAGLRESEDEQMARAVKESGDESGWTTVALPKKGKKGTAENSGEAAPQEVVKPKAAPAVVRSEPAKKASGFTALTVSDPNDPEAWAA